MAGIIARQPNGLLCRHSTVVDCVTDYNMTQEEFERILEEMNRPKEQCSHTST